jgi:3-oxoacyl-[acyl-carrier-protein] synthase II
MDITGKKAASGIKKLISISKRSLEDVDYYCGHGTATHTNDLAEGRSMAILYDGIDKEKRPPLGSIKPIYGHTFGVAGIINVAATAMMLKEQTLCPTINLKEVDPECEQDHVSEGYRKAKIDFAISLAFAIGSQSSFVSLGTLE